MKISQWDHIHNPVTGEHLRFLRRDPETDSATVEVIFPAGGLPVVEHRHPGWEKFEVQEGMLTLTVDRQVHQLGPGEQFTVTSEFHFGLARDGNVSPNGRPRDILAFALASERGAYQIAGPPRWLWVAVMTTLGWVAVLAGKRRKLERYWPPELERPWKIASGHE